MQERLERDFKRGSLLKTGKKYTTDSRKYDAYNEKFLEKFNQNFYKDLKRKILISIRSKLIRDKKFKLKRLVNFEKQNLTAIIYEIL